MTNFETWEVLEGTYWKKVHRFKSNKMSWGNFLGIGLEPRELHNWIAPLEFPKGNPALPRF